MSSLSHRLRPSPPAVAVLTALRHHDLPGSPAPLRQPRGRSLAHSDPICRRGSGGPHAGGCSEKTPRRSAYRSRRRCRGVHCCGHTRLPILPGPVLGFEGHWRQGPVPRQELDGRCDSEKNANASLQRCSRSTTHSSLTCASGRTVPAPLHFTSFLRAWTGTGACSGATPRTSMAWSSAWGFRQGCRSGRRPGGSERSRHRRAKHLPRLERRRPKTHPFRAKRPRPTRLHLGASRCTGSSASYDAPSALPSSPLTTTFRFHHPPFRARHAIFPHPSAQLCPKGSGEWAPSALTSFCTARSIPRES